MAISSKPTALEQTCYLYDVADPDVLYWKDWAKAFIDRCLELGWEVEKGPGTSLGSILWGIPYFYYSSDYYMQDVYGRAAWDCDWTKSDGIDGRREDYETANKLLFTGWFKDFPFWQNSSASNNYGIDEETGRFDFIVYTTKNSNEEKIGFRVKYPVCSIGYNSGNIYYEASANIMYTTPVFTIYNSNNGNIEIYQRSNENNYGSDMYYYGREPYERGRYKKYYYNFGNKGNSFNLRYGLLAYAKTNIVNQSRKLDQDNNYILESQKWNRDIQTNNAYPYSVFSVSTSDNSTDYIYSALANRLFKNNWKKYNKFCYQFSKTGDTSYFYICNADGDIGVKIITTTLENGEKATFLEDQTTGNTESDVIFSFGAVTENFSNTDTNFLIKVPTRPYKKISSQIGRFSLSRMLIPTQNILCKDLYYVTKKDSDDLIGNGVYIVVNDKESENHYFRIIPFGSYKVNEQSGDSTTYLAFPIADPEIDEENQSEGE